MSERDELFDERELRRALRLESDEVPPRFDVAAIAAAGREPPSGAFVAMLGGVGATAVVAVLVWQQLFALVPAAAPGLLDLAIAAVTAVATALVPLAETASQPAVPLVRPSRQIT